MKLNRTLCLLFFAAFSLLQSAEGLEIPPAPNTWIVDYASVLSPEAENELNQRLKKFEEETSNQIVAVTFPSLEGESLEDFSNRLFEKWRIGQKKNNNGVLLAVFVNDRKIRIEVGYGLEGALTDAISSRIIRNEITPEFRNGNYEAGIRKGIAAIESATRGEYKGTPPAENVRVSPTLIFFGILFAFMLLRAIFRLRRGSGVFIPDPRYRGRRRNRRDDWWIGGFPGGFGGGSGGGGFGGGGFSGGGGLSGGGGASGSW